MTEFLFGKKPKPQPLPQPKPEEQATSEFDLMRRRANAVQILTQGFSNQTPLGK